MYAAILAMIAIMVELHMYSPLLIGSSARIDQNNASCSFWYMSSVVPRRRWRASSGAMR